MKYFDISLSEMSDQRSIFKIYAERTQRHLFYYEGRVETHVHRSTVSDKALFYFRLFSFIFLTVIYIWSIAVIQKSLFENIMYLTMIGYAISWLYFGLTIQDSWLNFGGNPISKKLPQYIEIFHEIAFCTELPITLVFWGFLFNLVLKMEGVTTEVIVINGFLHSAPLILLAIDYGLNSFCFHINHVPVIITFDVLYMLINMTYTLTVKPIYGPIDWISVGSYIISVTSIILTLLVHYIGRVIHRKWKRERLARITTAQVPLLVPQSRRESQDNIRQTRQNHSLVHNGDL